MQFSPTVCTRSTNEIIKQMENDEFDGEINDKELALELLKYSMQPSATVCCANRIPWLYMAGTQQKDNEFYRRALKINVMAIAWDVFVVCDRKKSR